MLERVTFDLPNSVESRYTTGLCHALALALHRRTGAPMVAIWGVEGGEDCLAHLALRHPDHPGWVVDVRGVRPLDEAVREYYDIADPWTREATPDDVDRWVEDECRLAPLDEADLQDAGHVARWILRQMRSVREP